MILNFKSIHIHHFMSYDDVVVSLTDKGYCLISGVNENPKDAAKSNGAGKSTLFNALSFALTGETLQGLKSNLANIYFNDGCYIELDFEVNNDKYKLIRSKDDSTYGTNLKIYVNNEDKSGKGIRESQEILDTYLPDLTSELIGSVVLIGQGMPMKFSSNTPSGRKEVLEHLSKSDFMIQDLKERIEKRQSELYNKQTQNNNEMISINSQLDVYNNQKELKERESLQYVSSIDFDTEISKLQSEYDSREKEIAHAKEEYANFYNQYKNKSDELEKLHMSIASQKESLEKTHKDIEIGFIQNILIHEHNIKNLEDEINKLKSITDICPTCGQKIPNVVKPDTSKQEIELSKLKEELDDIKKQKKTDDNNYAEALEQCEKGWNESLNNAKAEQSKAATMLTASEETKCDLESKNSALFSRITKLVNDKNNFESNKSRIDTELKTINDTIENLNKDLMSKQDIEKTLTAHIDAINKMNTLIKRDFRGILLQDIITYIDNKMKEYASKIFNTDEISLALDGNNIDITFCNKDYASLSGGEAQRLDVIIQFAIRDFMSKYLNFSSNILVLDEITDALDAVSCDRVMNFITSELNDIESVFIISHHSDTLSIPTDSEIVVTKNIHGVSTVTKQ